MFYIFIFVIIFSQNVADLERITEDIAMLEAAHQELWDVDSFVKLKRILETMTAEPF